MKTDDDVGYYNAAVKIKTILVSVVTSLGAVLLPRASYYVQQNKMDEFRRISTKALNFVFLISVPLTVYFICFAKQGVFFLSGSEYGSAVLPMQIIMPTLIFIGITNILGIQILVPLGKEKTVLLSEIVGAVVDLALNAVLIPKFASAGAATGTLVAEFAVLVVQYIALAKEVTPMFRKIKYYKILTAVVAGFAASFRIDALGLGDFLTLLISAVVFFAVYGIVLLLMKEEFVVEMFKQFSGKFFRKADKH